VATVIRLQRAGTRNRPFYRVVVMDSRAPRDGAFLEKLGYYDPVPRPEMIQIERERVTHWVGQGAQLSQAVRALLRRLERRASGRLAAEEPAGPAAAETPVEGAAQE
jgi:small subunit ribosomal protein S16